MSNAGASVSEMRPAESRHEGLRDMPFLPYLEGLRGVAAIYVVLFHVRILLDPGYAAFGPIASTLPFRGQFLLYGHFAVGVFIVISGFVLTLPIAVRGYVSGGAGAFLRRRARRLMPGYYAALVLAVPLAVWRTCLDGSSPNALRVAAQFAAHAVLVHNLNVHTVWGLDSPLWSIALEAQIYVVFALLLMPVARRFGLTAFVLLAFSIGYAPTIVGGMLGTAAFSFPHACFWFFGLFALGSVAAFIAYDRNDRFASVRTRVPWKAVSMCSTVVFLVLVRPLYDDSRESSFLVDPFLGIAIAALFLAIAQTRRSGRVSRFASVFSWRPLVVLGSFSYSIYLIHDPILLVAMHFVLRLPPSLRLLVSYGVLVPGVIAIAFAFSQIFEKPYLSRFRREDDLDDSRRNESAAGTSSGKRD